MAGLSTCHRRSCGRQAPPYRPPPLPPRSNRPRRGHAAVLRRCSSACARGQQATDRLPVPRGPGAARRPASHRRRGHPGRSAERSWVFPLSLVFGSSEVSHLLPVLGSSGIFHLLLVFGSSEFSHLVFGSPAAFHLLLMFGSPRLLLVFGSPGLPLVFGSPGAFHFYQLVVGSSGAFRWLCISGPSVKMKNIETKEEIHMEL